MKTISFYDNNRSNNVLHIETENCIVNIRVNLKDMAGNKITSVEIIPDHYADRAIVLDGSINNRIIKMRRTISKNYLPEGFEIQTGTWAKIAHYKGYKYTRNTRNLDWTIGEKLDPIDLLAARTY